MMDEALVAKLLEAGSECEFDAGQASHRTLGKIASDLNLPA